MLYDQQLRKGMNYGELQPTISISIVNDVLFPGVPDYHLDFQLRSSKYPGLIFSDKQTLHVLELPKFHKKVEELANGLEVWCYFLIHGIDLDKNNLPATWRNSAVAQAVEVLHIMAQNDAEWERYQSRLKFQRDQAMYLKDAREKGLKEGRSEGLKEGLKEGRSEGLKEGLKEGRSEGIQAGEIVGQIHAYQRLLKLPLTPREELLALPLEELRSRAETLAQQLGVPKE